MNKLKFILSGHKKAAEELPLVHTSRCEFLPDFVRRHKIEPRLCPVFHESLVYLFYGRPAYRSQKGKQPGESCDLCPICFVFSPNEISKKLHRVYPCDTGAVDSGVFRPHLGTAALRDLELEPEIGSARRMVSLFFETNENYYRGKVRSTISATPTGAALGFYQLLLSTGPSKFDDRRSAIEIQVKETLSLRSKLLYVILPREFLDETRIRRAVFQTWKCRPIPYSTTAGDAPTVYHSVIREKLFEAYRDSTMIR